jgi:hypothetical protein
MKWRWDESAFVPADPSLEKTGKLLGKQWKRLQFRAMHAVIQSFKKRMAQVVGDL